MKKFYYILLAMFLFIAPVSADDIIGHGYGATREEARAFAVSDIKSQIIVEQESVLTIRQMVKNNRMYDSFTFLLTEYSRELPLFGLVYEDENDESAEYGMNWYSTAIIPESATKAYSDQIAILYNEIVEIDNLISNDNSGEKNTSWQQSLLDLCYDYSNYSLILSLLSPSFSTRELPVSMNRLRLEYEDMLKREQNNIAVNVAELTLRLAYDDLDSEGKALLEEYQNEYLEIANDIDELNGEERDRVTYASVEFQMDAPVSASDYLLRIESNRMAYEYYDDSPVDYDDKLEELSENIKEDIDTLNSSEFTASSVDSELAIEILSYNAEMRGWIARGSIMLGTKTLVFSFLIPYEELTGNEFSNEEFKILNSELWDTPEELIVLTIDYKVQGSYDSNTYNFIVNSLIIEKYIGTSKKETITIKEIDDIENPVTITFEYGLRSGLDYSQQLEGFRKRTQTEDKGTTKMRIGFFGGFDFGIPLPFDPGYFSDSFSTTQLNDYSFSLEVLLRFENIRKDHENRYYGAGLKIALPNLVTSVKIDDEKISMQREFVSIGINGFYTVYSKNSFSVDIKGGLGVLISASWGGFLEIGCNCNFFITPNVALGCYTGGNLSYRGEAFFFTPSVGMFVGYVL